MTPTRTSDMHIAQTFVHAVGIILLVFISVFCLACGLYTAAEWLEDHVKTSFRFIQRSTMFSIAVQMIWLLTDRSTLIPNIIGLLSHASSCVLLKSHPNHQASLMLIAAVVLLIAHQTSWVHWCLRHGDAWWQTISVLASLVWPVPTMLLLSTASNEALPTTVSPLAGSGRLTRSIIPTSPSAAGGISSFSPRQSPTAADTPTAAFRRHLVKGATRTWHQVHPQQPLLPEMDDVGHHREVDQTEKARMMSLLGDGREGSSMQQLLRTKQHRSMVVRGFEVLTHYVRPLLPVREADAAAAGGSSRFTLSKSL